MAKKAKKVAKAQDKVRKPISRAPRPKAPTPAPESKERLEKGHEWYDDGGNEGLKQRPIEN